MKIKSFTDKNKIIKKYVDIEIEKASETVKPGDLEAAFHHYRSCDENAVRHLSNGQYGRRKRLVFQTDARSERFRRNHQ